MSLPEKADLRREIGLYLKTVAPTIKAKSQLIRDRLMTIPPFRHARQSERLMSYVSMPSEIDTLPLFTGNSMIVPYCEADEIIPIRIRTLEELEPAGTMKVLEPKFAVRQDVSRQVLPEQIDVVLVPGLAFDRFGNRLGRGRGYYDRFLRRLPADVLTIGLALDGMLRDQIPLDENDSPVKVVITESRTLPDAP
jgi:5-formyltetrahydrofolate cyclo-ligase